jgi:hypothetical protein
MVWIITNKKKPRLNSVNRGYRFFCLSSVPVVFSSTHFGINGNVDSVLTKKNTYESVLSHRCRTILVWGLNGAAWTLHSCSFALCTVYYTALKRRIINA